MVVACHRAIPPADVGAAAPTRVEGLMQAGFWKISAALKAAGSAYGLSPRLAEMALCPAGGMLF